MSSVYQLFLAKLPVREVETEGELHRLSLEEVQRLRKIHRSALTVSAFIAVAGFLFYYLPTYYFPRLFPLTWVPLPIVGRQQLPVVETLWGVLEMVLEIYALVLLNVYSVHETAVATGYLTAENKPERGGAVLDVGLEKRNKEIARYGIDPFQGANKATLVVLNLVLRLKGFLGNKLLRYLVRRIFGRLAVRAVLDFVGLPIYMAINALSTHAVLKEARVVIMGRNLIDLMMPRMPLEAAATPEAKALLYDTLQFIAVSKRDYHENHYVLTHRVFERYGIEPEASHPVPTDYLERVTAAAPKLRDLCALLVVLGFILDGEVSGREKRRIAELNARGALAEDARAIEALADAFSSGEGVEPLLTRYLGPPPGR